MWKHCWAAHPLASSTAVNTDANPDTDAAIANMTPDELTASGRRGLDKLKITIGIPAAPTTNSNEQGTNENE